jgi:hypothetical protein
MVSRWPMKKDCDLVDLARANLGVAQIPAKMKGGVGERYQSCGAFGIQFG